MIAALLDLDVSVPGLGSNAFINFDAVIDTTDPLDLNAQRPPAIGLAHELIHAYRNAYGQQPGWAINHYSTTLAELAAVGAGPFAGTEISENNIRAEWNAVQNTQLRRTIYTQPGQDQTAENLRNLYATI